MEKIQTNDIEALNDLISLCLDSNKGYREAAGKCNNPSLKQMFDSRALERMQIAGEMQSEVRHMGGTPNEHGTMAGAAHRVIMNVMTMVGDDTTVAINECERGEDVIKAAFEKRMTMEGLSANVRSMITQCFSSIKAGHDQLSALKKAAA